MKGCGGLKGAVRSVAENMCEYTFVFRTEEIKSDAELKSIPPSVELLALHLRKSKIGNGIITPTPSGCLFFCCYSQTFSHKPFGYRHLSMGDESQGRNALFGQTGLSERAVRTSLSRLKTTGEVTVKTTNQYSVTTINYYDAYQPSQIIDDQQNA